MSQLLQDLRAARALIEDPKRWTTKANARNANGHAVSPSHASACMWCAAGAIQRVILPDDVRYERASTALTRAAGDGFGYVEINDRDGHAAVLALYDRAIAKEEAK